MKILMVGLGGIGQRHVRNIRALMGVKAEILAYRTRNRAQVLTDQLGVESGTNLADKYGISVYTDFGQALDQEPDVVFVCNPSSLHMPIALQAAQAGCNLFVEKPLSHTMDCVEQLAGLVATKKVKAVVGYQMRFHPCLKQLGSLIHAGTIGRILSVRAEVGEYLPGWHGYEDYREMYASRRQLGGGVILSQIHELDYIYWILGLPMSVYAVGGHASSLEIDVEDTVDILMGYQIHGHSIPVSLHQDYVQRPPSRSCQVVGDAGKIMVDLRALTVSLWDRDGKLVEIASYEGFQRNQLFMDELQSFFAHIRGEPTLLPSISEAAQSLRMALAARESLDSGAVIKLAGGPR